MEIPVSSWYQAIFQRKSRRSFMADRPITEDQFNRLESLSRTFRPFSDARVKIIRQAPDNILRGIIGSYGRITGAPAYAVMLGTASSPSSPEHVGYIGEALLLEATAIGLGTCWVSGMFRRNGVQKQIHLAVDERIFAVTPLGYGERDFTVKEKIYVGIAGSSKRKNLAAITEGTSPLPWQGKALEAARIAPSARNRQPWRFLVAPDAITIRLDTPQDSDRYPKRLDCGIAMLHLELGARSAGVAGHWISVEPPQVARYENSEAIGSGRTR
jgi:nitroreductase